MFRFIGKTFRFVLGAAALLSFLGLLAVLALWRDSRETVHMGRYGGATRGYYDVAFNKGRVQITGIRQSARELSPHWLTRPVPSQPTMTANPLVIWDFDATEKVVWNLEKKDAEYPNGVVYRRGLAQWSATGAEDEALTEPKIGHAVIAPTWVAAAALAVLPMLWLLIAIPARALRRRRREALAHRAEADPDEANRNMATA